MNFFFIIIIMLMVFTQVSEQNNVDSGIPLIEDRTLPTDLEDAMKKTDIELAFEACMTEYSSCLSLQKTRANYDYRVCGLESLTTKKATFNTHCELMYENCKQSQNDGGWGFFHDGPCAVEFISA